MTGNRDYQVCTRCLMDTSDPLIQFDSEGVCNYCQEASSIYKSLKFTDEEGDRNLSQMAKKIKSDAAGKKYDSIIGVSGGVDSSYVVHIAYKYNLNPLIVHFDNGWNSETSVMNIKRLIDKTGFDLETYVIDWPEFRDLQRSFLRAGVTDIEVLTDHAIMATMFGIRRKKKIKYVLSGTNYATEHGMPESWVWHKQDFKNIKSIHSRFGEVRLKSYPTLNTIKMNLIKSFGLGGTFVEPLNKINYRKSDAMKTLMEEYGWKYYGGKHYESIFTKFYQAYILPTKFGIDKRKAHLSSLIRNSEISREEALAELNMELYPEDELRVDKEYVIKKLGFSEDEFEKIMNSPAKSHLDYPSERKLVDSLKSIMKRLNLEKIYADKAY